jgi:hypothetical protein
MKSEPAVELEAGYTRMQLSYCERCGALRVRAAADSSPFCPSCARTLSWLEGEARS